MTRDGFGSQRFQRALKATDAHMLDEPVKAGSFYCHAEIARGGQGTVFLSTGDDQALSRVCVVKTFLNGDTDTIGKVRRSIRTQLALVDEASTWPARRHRGHVQIRPTRWVPDILAWDLDSPYPWVAQDFRGANLRDYLANAGESQASTSQPSSRARMFGPERLLSQIALAVEFVHLQGVVHRDLKPDNILVEELGASQFRSESIALCDFDLSRSRGQTTLTQTAVGMGTPGYSAPEQLWISARDVTYSSDVYSVAMLAVFLYTGSEPWNVMVGPDLMRLRLDPDVAQRLGKKREWVEQALSFAPEDRPPLAGLHAKLQGPETAG